jgi:dTDP-4-dehydrorhamnose reductase
VPLDLTDADAVAALVARCGATAVVNAAYRQHGDDAEAVNVDGAANAARAAAAVGARLVHLSTDVVFDGRLGRPYVEDDPRSPLSPYGRTKAEAEQAVAAADPGAALVRTSLIYGGPGAEPSGHEQMALDPDASFFVDELRNPTQVGDLAAAVVELCRPEHTGLVGPLHVAGADALSRHRFAELIAGRPVTGVVAPPGRPLDCRLDTTLATERLTTRLRGAREVFAPTPPP